jgi:hypothetical protein
VNISEDYRLSPRQSITAGTFADKQSNYIRIMLITNHDTHGKPAAGRLKPQVGRREFQDQFLGDSCLGQHRLSGTLTQSFGFTSMAALSVLGRR